MLVRVAAVAALGGFLFGYDLGLIGGAMLGISQAFNITSNTTKEAIVGAAKLGAFFGTFIGGVLMLRYGRRIAIACEAGFFVLGPLLMSVSTSTGGLVVGRLLVGLGVGASAIVVPAYLAEIAPAEKRGAVVQTYEIMLTLGMLCSGVVDWLLSRTGGSAAWRWMVGLPALPGALLLVSLVLLPESPRWLVLRGQLDLALATLHSIIQSSSGSGRTAAEQSVIAASEAQAVAKAEDELLLLWSSVQKEQAATVNIRQQHRQHTTAPAAATAAGTGAQRDNVNGSSEQHYQQQYFAASAIYQPPVVGTTTLAAAAAAAGAGGAFAPAAAPADVFTLEDGTNSRGVDAGDGDGTDSAEAAAVRQQSTQAPPAAGDGEGYALAAAGGGGAAAGSGGGGGGGAVGYVSAEQSRRTTSVDDDADTGANRHQQHKQQHHGHYNAADDSQSEQLLSHHHQDSSNDSSTRPAGQLYRNNTAGAAGSTESGFMAWIRGWLRGSNSNVLHGSSSSEISTTAAAASSIHQQEVCEPGQEANVFASLWAMLTDIITVMRGPERRAAAIAASLAVLNQATASTAVINYTPEVLSTVLGVTSQGSAILYPAVITVTKCVGVGISLLVVDAWGRRPLLIYGGAGCGVALLLAGLALAVSSVPLFLACLCLFIFSFSVSWAGLYWVVVSEIFSMGAKSPATSAATSLLFLTGSVVDFVFLSLVSWLGAGAFGLFAAVAVGSAWYVYRNVPETKGRTLVEIQALLAAPAAAGGAAAAASGGVGRYGRWRGWDWGRNGTPGPAAARRDIAVLDGQAGESTPLHQQQQDQQQQHQDPLRPTGLSSLQERSQRGPDHSSSSSSMDGADNGGGQYWQDWMHQQQQRQSGGGQGMSLPLGLQLTAVGSRQGGQLT